jgi:hypothetical protein
VLLHRQDLQGGLVELEPLALVAEARLAAEEPDDDTEGLVLARPEQPRVDAVDARIGRQGTRSRAEHGAAARHLVELGDALGHVEGVVVRQGDHTRAEHDPGRALAGRGEEHLRAGDGLPPGRVVLPAPELVEPELVELLDEVEVTPVQEHRVLADGMMRSEKGTESQPHRREGNRQATRRAMRLPAPRLRRKPAPVPCGRWAGSPKPSAMPSTSMATSCAVTP